QGMTGVMMREQGQQMPQPQAFGEEILNGDFRLGGGEVTQEAVAGREPLPIDFLKSALKQSMLNRDYDNALKFQKAIQESEKTTNEYYGGLTEGIDPKTGQPVLLAMTKKGAVPSGYAPRPKDGKAVPVVRNGKPVTVKVPGTNEVKILMSDGTYSSGGSIPIVKPEPKERPEQYWPDDGLQGQPFLDTMTAAMAARVKSIAGGRSKLPSYAAMRRDPTLAKIVEAVYKYDPSYEEQRFGNRYFAQKSYLPGQKNGMLILSNASALGHMQVLREAYNAMKNGDLKAINSIANKYKVQTGSAPEAVFNAIKGVIGAEVMKSIVPGGGGVVEREEVRETLSREYSNDQFMGVLGGYEALMQEQYDNMRQDYERNDLDPKLWPTYKTHDEKKADKAHGGGKTVDATVTPQTKIVKTRADLDKVKSGESYIAPDGKLWVKP
ncbi:MAG: hypothetical protein KAY00_01440, partial [Agitococcus sp.]|nr:hypothetical protein [Agitococcus sp.]